MTYNSIAEIFDDIDGTRVVLLRDIEDLSDEQQAFRTSPDSWSVAEIVEHLSIIEGNVARLLGSLLGKAEEAGQARATDAPFAPVSIDDFVEESLKQKYSAPERVRPVGLPLADSLSRLRDSRAAIQALRTRVESADGVAINFPHPVWGPLNLYQWLAFIGAHESRHLAQINALKQAMKAE